jgi:hypothetical protein
MDGKSKRKLISRLAIMGGLILCIGAVFVGFKFMQPEVDAYRHRDQFNSADWKSRSLDGDAMWPTRLRMVDDLMQRKHLEGQPRARVEELLGPPDRTEYFRDWDMVYFLGPERGYTRIDSEWLVLRLSAAGTVTEYRLTRD